MADQTHEQRIAALRARRATSDRTATAPATTDPAGEPEPGASGSAPSAARTHRIDPLKAATFGASVVSFGAMIAAMGPFTTHQADADDGDMQPAAAVPQAPANIVVEVVPNLVHRDGSPVESEASPAIEDATPAPTTGEFTLAGLGDAIDDAPVPVAEGGSGLTGAPATSASAATSSPTAPPAHTPTTHRPADDGGPTGGANPQPGSGSVSAATPVPAPPTATAAPPPTPAPPPPTATPAPPPPTATSVPAPTTKKS